MVGYDHLSITNREDGREAIEKVLPSSTTRYGSSHSKAVLTWDYEFNPALSANEVKGLTAKLIDLNVKGFSFSQTLA